MVGVVLEDERWKLTIRPKFGYADLSCVSDEFIDFSAKIVQALWRER